MLFPILPYSPIKGPALVDGTFLDGMIFQINALNGGASPVFGKNIFVNGATGADNLSGASASAPLATIGAALSAASNNDVIIVAPGTYAENLVTTKTHISLIAGAPSGNAKRVAVAPATGIALDLRTGCLAFAAAGIRFVGTSAVGAKIAADGCAFYDCDFTSDTSHGCSLVGQTVDAANTGSGTQFENCIFRECGGMGLNQGFTTGKTLFATNVNVWNCQFYLNTGADIGDENEGIGNGYWNQWDINGCKFMDLAKATILAMKGGNAGADILISNCFFNRRSGMANTECAIPADATMVACYEGTGIIDSSAF